MNEIMCLPVCKKEGHGQMKLACGATYEQRWIGTTYVCQRHDCFNSVTFTSPELKEELLLQAQRSSRRQESLL